MENTKCLILLASIVMVTTTSLAHDVITENACHPCRTGSAHTNNVHRLFQRQTTESIAELLGAFVYRINDVNEKVNHSISNIVSSNYGGDVGYLCSLRMAGDEDIPTPTLSYLRQINPLTQSYNQLATLALYFEVLNSDVIRSCGLDFSHLRGTLPLCHWKKILRHFRHHLPIEYCQKSFPVDGVNSCTTAVDLAYVILESCRGMLSVLESRGNIYKALINQEASALSALQLIINSHIM
ncbi:hypothetical protein LOTGIDRAFT_159723 [Lottia gigantea]|uniref:Uncharacterized protein n=1 Tax=Lottia gigantea TaxID=225164 RepID=V4AQ95_LOTGI|nr:hypothetical protein LOTGIDRAFT_159723 [Lottia gigantea]ESO96975.1 hypothetical protein LOTGIDRAFT_159723 [Lottia gigantea]